MELSLHNLPPLITLIYALFERVERFGHWFDRRFGWFFTNGMKEKPETGTSSFRA